jgi:formylglycine-generating enzyme required for sulfatase activity
VAGSYTLTVTPTASGKTDTKTATLIVEPKPANIEITNKPTGSVDTWSPIILNVTRADTPAFTVEITSADPSNGISCDTPTADSVTCTPNKAGTYVLTITASADSEKTDTVTITAQEPDGLSVGSAESETKITMVRVEKTGDGTETDKGFLMGCTRNEGQWTSSNCGTSEYRAHTMKLTEDFYIGKYEVTQKLWKHVMGTNPSEVQEFNGAINENLPVTNVHYDDVKEFLDGLNNKGSHATTEYLIPGMKWDFPSDAQWEYAARGGHKPTNCPDELGEGGSNKWGCLYSGNNFQGYVAWYGNSMGGTTAPASGGIDSIHPVGMDKPLAVDASKNSFNELGLYDMSGNVAEWVFDWYEKPNVDSKTDYIVTSGTKRIVRGGNYTSGQTDITVANRPDVFVINPFRTGTTGFRLALISDTEYERRYPTAP